MNEQLQLNVHVIEARDIPKMDLIGRADPYCILKLSSDKNEKRTKYIKNTYSPTWDEKFYFKINNMSDEIIFKLYDYDKLKSDDAISLLRIPLAKIPRGQIYETWYDCSPVKGNKKGGSIHLKFHITKEGQVPFVVNQIDTNITNGLGSFHNNLTMGSSQFIQEARRRAEMMKQENLKAQGMVPNAPQSIQSNNNQHMSSPYQSTQPQNQSQYPPPAGQQYPPPQQPAYPPPADQQYPPPQQPAYPPPADQQYPPQQQLPYPSQPGYPPQGQYPPASTPNYPPSSGSYPPHPAYPPAPYPNYPPPSGAYPQYPPPNYQIPSQYGSYNVNLSNPMMAALPPAQNPYGSYSQQYPNYPPPPNQY